LIMAAATIVLSFLAQSAHSPGNWDAESGVGDSLVFVSFMAFPIVGALLASRRSRNPIGWICLISGLFWMLIIVSEGYSTYGLTVPDSVPFPVTIYALLYAWLWVPTVGLIGIYLILLFPDGKLPSRRWRPFAWFAGVVILLESVIVFLTPGPLDGLGHARNPLGLDGYPLLEVLGWGLLLMLPLCMLASASSLVLRFRRSGREERQQIKWIAFAASFMGSVYLLIMSAGLINWLISAPGVVVSDLGTQTLWGALLEDGMLLSFAAIPVTIGFAIFRCRLYDIDAIINRTLVYGSLTVMLVGIYLGAVISFQYAFRAVSGQENQLAVVASTLTIAAMFNPLRRRVHELVDRRFYRNKYDAAKTLAAFSARLRDETDLEALNDNLAGVVSETMQPAHVRFWVRPPIGVGKVGGEEREQ
jgi:hypothetical protein